MVKLAGECLRHLLFTGDQVWDDFPGKDQNGFGQVLAVGGYGCNQVSQGRRVNRITRTASGFGASLS
jgi:hypothetical protein